MPDPTGVDPPPHCRHDVSGVPVTFAELLPRPNGSLKRSVRMLERRPHLVTEDLALATALRSDDVDDDPAKSRGSATCLVVAEDG